MKIFAELKNLLQAMSFQEKERQTQTERERVMVFSSLVFVYYKGECDHGRYHGHKGSVCIII